MNWFSEIASFLQRNQAVAAIIAAAVGGAATFVWPAAQFFLVRRREAEYRDFETYHRLIRDLVQPDVTGATYVDRQAAVVFELRHFKRYHDFSLRTLKHLRQKWGGQDAPHHRLLEEMDLTIEFLQRLRN